jgi:aryl-alcohol dehydrogenase-like predicted oxidoreductase
MEEAEMVAHLAASGRYRVMPIATQPLYNLVNSEAEVEQLPAASFYGVGVVTYSPLACGILTSPASTSPKAAPDVDQSAVG